jgi:hypothetical protein
MTPRPGKPLIAAARQPAGGRLLRGVGLAALLALAACAGAGGGVVYSSDFTAGYAPDSLRAMMSRTPLLVETYGSPAPNLDRADITRASVLALRASGPTWFPRNYTGAPGDAPQAAYILRIAYGLPKAFNRQRICAPEMRSESLQSGGAGQEPATRTLAAVCRGTTAIAVAEGSPGVNPDIGGQRFAAFVGLLGRQVMPRRNPVTQDDCIFRRCD